ncbi:class I adenylate-forming enzyme family protein [Thioalkalivibrio paradoxus]|uniref:Long-chain fatty acid--CoA ligase n=1 Tax=Thioalkalivibrio paradoxus ARh 1 TaxID=713585 RepID=W0DN99_9GAMM|nr:class I adenylate-forming enzyme family protein [Thioalkalivibrio paradoxus]AHE99936.1 hypothetical protein THITH_04295 [Thioalkalivibrio paradoxus ARh 1]
MLFHYIAHRAGAWPDATALVCGEQRLSYADLIAEVRREAGRLRGAGVREGDAVVLRLPNGPDFVIGFLALSALGALAMPMAADATADEILRLAQVRPVRLVLTEHPLDFAGSLVADGPPRCLAPHELPVAPPLRTVSGSDGPLLCQRSSGSSGEPKSVTRTQRHCVEESKMLAAAAGVGPGDATLAAIPLCHAHGLGNCLLLALCNGARLVILPPRVMPGNNREVPLPLRRKELLNLVLGERITILPGVPALFSLLCDAAMRGSPEHSLRLCFTAGSPLARDIHDRFVAGFGVALRQLYGSTETGAVAINLAVEAGDNWESVGQPLPGCEVRIGGCTEGEADGEIALRSPAMATGYADHPVLTRERFVDGWFLPGDMARRDAHGDVRILGRLRPFIVSAGHKVDPAEVEAVLCEHAAIDEAVVVGTPHASAGELVRAFVAGAVRVPEQELVRHCRERLSPYKVPRRIHVLDALPRTALGKVSTDMLLKMQGMDL